LPRLGRQSDHRWMRKTPTSAPNALLLLVLGKRLRHVPIDFAVITPALIIGSIVERMKFNAIFVFMTCGFYRFFTQARVGINGYRPRGNATPISRRWLCRWSVVPIPRLFRPSLRDPWQSQRLRQGQLRRRTASSHLHRHGIGGLAVCFTCRFRRVRLT